MTRDVMPHAGDRRPRGSRASPPTGVSVTRGALLALGARSYFQMSGRDRAPQSLSSLGNGCIVNK
jgi:hypothetical protein